MRPPNQSRRPHWTQKWLGRPWREDEYECAAFTVEVLKAEFGVPFGAAAPAAEGGVRRHDAQFEAYLRSGKIRRVAGMPEEGDGVLMRSAHGVRLRRFHMGVFVAGADNEPWVLHLVEDLGSALHPVGRLEELGYALEGYYRWT